MLSDENLDLKGHGISLNVEYRDISRRGLHAVFVTRKHCVQANLLIEIVYQTMSLVVDSDVSNQIKSIESSASTFQMVHNVHCPVVQKVRRNHV